MTWTGSCGLWLWGSPRSQNLLPLLICNNEQTLFKGHKSFLSSKSCPLRSRTQCF